MPPTDAGASPRGRARGNLPVRWETDNIGRSTAKLRTLRASQPASALSRVRLDPSFRVRDASPRSQVVRRFERNIGREHARRTDPMEVSAAKAAAGRQNPLQNEALFPGGSPLDSRIDLRG